MTTIHDPEVDDQLDSEHFAGWNDTGDAYRLSLDKVVLRCLWCTYLIIGDTAEEVVMVYRRDHEKPIFARVRQKEATSKKRDTP